jgi:hypothetical protein
VKHSMHCPVKGNMRCCRVCSSKNKVKQNQYFCKKCDRYALCHILSCGTLQQASECIICTATIKLNVSHVLIVGSYSNSVQIFGCHLPTVAFCAYSRQVARHCDLVPVSRTELLCCAQCLTAPCDSGVVCAVSYIMKSINLRMKNVHGYILKTTPVSAPVLTVIGR